jgi:hypothetical protein
MQLQCMVSRLFEETIETALCIKAVSPGPAGQ